MCWALARAVSFLRYWKQWLSPDPELNTPLTLARRMSYLQTHPQAFSDSTDAVLDFVNGRAAADARVPWVFNLHSDGTDRLSKMNRSKDSLQCISLGSPFGTHRLLVLACNAKEFPEVRLIFHVVMRWSLLQLSHGSLSDRSWDGRSWESCRRGETCQFRSWQYHVEG